MREVSIDGNILNIGGTKITVKYPIKQVESISGKYVVLLKIPRVELGAEELNNILCWRISDKLPSNIVSKEQIPYVAIQIMNGKLYATDFWGRKFNVDVENGNLMDVKIVR